MALFESYERRVDKINAVLAEYGINSIEECRAICKEKGFDPYEIVKGVQPIAFENAGWAYCVGAAIAIKKGVQDRRRSCRGHRHRPAERSASPAPSPTTARSVSATAISARCCCSDDTEVLLPSSPATSPLPPPKAPSASSATRTRPARSLCASSSTVSARTPPRSSRRINGFTYVQTQFDYYTGELTIVREIPLLQGRARRRPLLRRGRRPRGRGHHAPRGRGRVHHRQLHQPDPLPAPGRRHLQEMSASSRARSTSPSPPAAARAARCTRTTWPPAPPPTA